MYVQKFPPICISMERTFSSLQLFRREWLNVWRLSARRHRLSFPSCIYLNILNDKKLPRCELLFVGMESSWYESFKIISRHIMSIMQKIRHFTRLNWELVRTMIVMKSKANRKLK